MADPSRGRGAICLAVSPALKAKGVKNRCRIFEIPESLEYITALPRMKRYMQMSAEIYSIYLKYISPEDIHVYSIDECFIDITPYLGPYGKTPHGMARMLMDAVLRETGISAAAGIGTNLFLAKVALDITAKKAADRIGYLDDAAFRREIWHHRPITDVWNIGRGTAARLAKYGVSDLHGVTLLPEERLFREFGVNARYLIDHAHGIEPCTIADIHNYRSKSASLSNGQILFEDYSADDAEIVLREMVDMLTLELVEKHLVAGAVSLSVAYSKDVVRPTGGSRRLGEHTSSFKKIMPAFERLYRETVCRTAPIRRLNVGLESVEDELYESISLFSDPETDKKEKALQKAVISIKGKYGKNAILKGTSFREKATGRQRNKLTGGHNSE